MTKNSTAIRCSTHVPTVDSSEPLFPARWRWRGLILCHAIVFLLLGSWLWGVTRPLWVRFDQWLFLALNSSLEISRAWAAVWAFASLRPIDILVALIMGAIILWRGLIFPAHRTWDAFFGFAALVILVAALRQALAWPIGYLADVQGYSPSLVMPEPVRLSKMFDWDMKIKDESKNCFPGDHATITILWGIYLFRFATGWRLVMVWGLALLFLMPRMIAGAHWGSDNLVGGVSMALLVFGWGCHSPYFARMVGLSHRLKRFIPLVARRAQT